MVSSSTAVIAIGVLIAMAGMDLYNRGDAADQNKLSVDEMVAEASLGKRVHVAFCTS